MNDTPNCMTSLYDTHAALRGVNRQVIAKIDGCLAIAPRYDTSQARHRLKFHLDLIGTGAGPMVRAQKAGTDGSVLVSGGSGAALNQRHAVDTLPGSLQRMCIRRLHPTA